MEPSIRLEEIRIVQFAIPWPNARDAKDGRPPGLQGVERGVRGGGGGTKYAWAIAYTPSDSPVAPFVVPQLDSWLSAAFVVVI